MKAEERKQIETNSLILTYQKWRQQLSGRSLYYLIGVVALVVGGVLIYRYFAAEARRAKDAILLQWASADTPEKLKQGMEDHRGTVYGSLFKIQLARHLLNSEGLPKLGTDSAERRTQAANAIEQARTYFLELTGELKEKEQAALVQESWLGAAQAEEALVGLPGAGGSADSRGNPDKAIEYWGKAGDIFPDTEFSKKYKERAEKLRATKDQWVAAQKAIYADRGPGPGAGSLFPPKGPLFPKDTPFLPSVPTATGSAPATTGTGVPTAPAVTVPAVPTVPTVPPKTAGTATTGGTTATTPAGKATETPKAK